MTKLAWKSDGKGTRCYRAFDGDRQWAIGIDLDGRTWSVVLHDDRPGSPHILDDFGTLREAKEFCESEARKR